MGPARMLATVVLAAGVAMAPAGCGAGVSQADQVRAKVRQFAIATERRDARALCHQVLAPVLVTRLAAAGLTCVQAMKVFVASVADPTISISKVTVSGRHASAVVLAGAAGQTSALESIRLVQTRAGWRLVSLASPR